MDETQFPNIGDFFDAWALNGRDLSMEKGHSKAVNKFLRSIDFTDSFSFLDVGCGNGWVVRAMAEHAKCALGIDVSAGMIKTAKSKSISKKEAHNLIQTNGFHYANKIRLITYFACMLQLRFSQRCS